MGSIVLPHRVVRGYMYICCSFLYWRVHRRFYGFDGIWWFLRDLAMDVLDLEMVINDEENNCGFED